MKRPRVIILAIAAVALVLVLLVRLRLGPPDPVYGGEALSDHLYTIYAPGPDLRGANTNASVRAQIIADDKKRAASREVLGVRQGVWAQAWEGMIKGEVPYRVGKEAVPLITNWLAAPPVPRWRAALAERVSRFANIPQLAADRRLIAWKFLAEYPLVLDDPLRIFVPALTNVDRTIRVSAMIALQRSFAQGLRVDKDVAFRALFPLSSFHESAKAPDEKSFLSDYSGFWNQSIPDQTRDLLLRLDPAREVLPLYTLEMGQVPARVGAAEELARNPRLPERAIPLLISNLGSSNRSVIEGCAIALGAYGPAAEPAVPRLRELLEHPRGRIRVAASNSLASIASGRAR